MAVLNAAIMIIFKAHEGMKASKLLRNIAEVIFRVMLAIAIEITGSGITTAVSATGLSCLVEIQDKISGEATIRIVLGQGKINGTATSAATTVFRISIGSEIHATRLNPPDITEVLSSIRLTVRRL